MAVDGAGAFTLAEILPNCAPLERFAFGGGDYGAGGGPGSAHFELRFYPAFVEYPGLVVAPQPLGGVFVGIVVAAVDLKWLTVCGRARSGRR